MKTTARKSPTTPAAFRRHAERIIRTANPDAEHAGLVIEWLRCTRVTWHDGSKGFSGTVRLVSPGHRTTKMIATSTDDAVMVR